MLGNMTSTKQSAGVQLSDEKILCPYDDCEKSYTTFSHLNRHEDAHTGKIYRCEKCAITFKTQYSLKRHMDNIHLKKKPKKYKCDYCEEDFNKKSWLNRHIFRHTGIKPYACTFENCDAKFLVPSKLKKHLKVHEGHVCPKENCNEKFAKWTQVRRHLKLVHPKMYKCPECEQKFSRSNNLKSHLILHKSDRHVYLCPKQDCCRFYSKESILNRHIKSYHEMRPFNCTIGQCSRAFKSQQDLEGHLSRHSPSGRLKKRKKKKSKPKASFAVELAGLAPKKWQVDVLKGTYGSANANAKPCSDSVSGHDHNKPQLENIRKNEAVISSAAKNCDEVSYLLTNNEEKNNNIPNLNLKNDDSDYQNNDIHALLNMIEKRKVFEARSAT